MKTLKCNDLTYLEDAPLFKDKVAFKINDEEYTVKESYSEYKKEKDYLHILESKCYDNNITDFDIKVINGNCIQSYKSEGPAIFSYRKPPANSTKFIINREAKSIGYKISTGDIMNTTKMVDHIIFSKKTEELMRITKEFYKGSKEDKDNPKLNMIIDIRITGTEATGNTFLIGEETRTFFDKDGNIEELVIGDTKYAYTSTGEFICIDFKFTYTSSPDHKRLVIPKLVQENIGEEVGYYVQFYQKENPDVILASEYFIEDFNNDCLVLVSSDINGKKTEFKHTELGIEFVSKFTDSNGKIYTTSGITNYPLSSDFFVFDEYQKNITFTMTPYFNNIYETEFFGDALLTNTYLKSISVENEDGTKERLIHYNYDGIYKSQKYVFKFGANTNKEICLRADTMLPNGNILRESIINADPLSGKSIFYEAAEFDKTDESKVSSYKALIVKHIDRN